MKTLIGTVTSTKMAQSAAVNVSHTWTHPKYKKTVKKSKQYIVDNKIGAQISDTVVIQETRPVSKLKHFAITKIIEAAKIVSTQKSK
jgi:small subunit ribosomal protein S17